MLKPGGSRGKQKGALAVLSCGMAELLNFLSELEPHSREKLYFYLLRRFGQRRRKTLIYNGDGETFAFSSALNPMEENCWCSDCWSLITQDTQSGVIVGRLAGGLQHLKPIREFWNIPQGSSTLARGHHKGPRKEGSCDSDADKQPARWNTKNWIWESLMKKKKLCYVAVFRKKTWVF